MNKLKPKISIIFPSYNGESFLIRNLESIRNLTNLNEIELIIIDNNSNDSSIKIIKKYQNYINLKLYQSKKNVGFVKACNFGISKSNSEFVFITNQDVIFPSDFFYDLLKIYNKLERKGDIVLSPSLIFENDGIHYFGAKIHILGFSYTPNLGEKMSTEKIIKKTNRFSGGTFFIKRQTYLKLGGFDDRLFMYYEDTDFSLRIL